MCELDTLREVVGSLHPTSPNIQAHLYLGQNEGILTVSLMIFLLEDSRLEESGVMDVEISGAQTDSTSEVSTHAGQKPGGTMTQNRAGMDKYLSED